MKAIYVIFVGILISGATLHAQSNIYKNNPYNISELGIKNYMIGLTSSNNGLKRSCIFHLGQYKIKEATRELMSLLDKEKLSKNRILVALALYNIGEKKGIQKVNDHAFIDIEPEVRRMCAAIVSEYGKNSSNEN